MAEIKHDLAQRINETTTPVEYPEVSIALLELAFERGFGTEDNAADVLYLAQSAVQRVVRRRNGSVQ